MEQTEKISEIISNQYKFEKPLLIYIVPPKKYSSSKSYLITKHIEKRLDRAAIYSCDKNLNSYSQLITLIEKDKSPFIVLDEFEKAWDNKGLVLWASKRKNLILIATVNEVPENLNEFFTIKKYIR